MHTSASRSAGFTLIELLITISILGILAAMTIFNVTSIRNSAYAQKVSAVRHDGVNALAAGAGEVENDSSYAAPISISKTRTPGRVTGANSFIVPGMTLPDDVYFYAYFDPTCRHNTICLREYVYVRHCKTGRVSYQAYWADSYGAAYEYDSGMRC